MPGFGRFIEESKNVVKEKNEKTFPSNSRNHRGDK